MTAPFADIALPPELEGRVEAVRAALRDLGSVLVAFSGGSDSALLLALAHQALGDRAAAAMGISATYPQDEVEQARVVAAEIGVRMHEIPTRQMEHDAFLRNDSQRCYHCRDELYAQLRSVAGAHGLAAICDGTIADDLREHRPGRRAAQEAGVCTPLADAGITKEEVRLVSRVLGLRTWDKPQQACLSSRIPRGTPITLTSLRRVERAEAALRAEGFRQNRVREHGDCARLEVEAQDIPRLLDEALRTRLVAALRDAGYAFVSLDLEGFGSGRMNRLVPAVELEVTP